jgi:Protein of unknown function (DUF1018)
LPTHDFKYMAGKVDRKHIAQIKVAQKYLNMSDQDYRAMLMRVGNVESSRELNLAGFAAVMDEFRRFGFESKAVVERRKRPERDPGHVTYDQRLKMQRLWDGWEGKEDTAGLRRWIQKKWGISSPKFMDATTATKAIAALENFKKI